MKNKIAGVIVGLSLIGGVMSASAQTVTTNQVPNLMPPSNNPVTQGFEAIGQAIVGSTNWTAAAFGGVDTTGSKYIIGAEVAYGFNQYVGLVAGVEDLFAKGHQSQFSAVKGGITLSYPLHPFSFLGSTALTNIVADPFISDQIATPSGNANLGNLLVYGINFNITSFSNFELVGGVDYETRTGQGYWDGDYWLIHVGISRRF